MKIQTKRLVSTALLIAIAIVIPIQFGFLKIIVGPFTATIASHVPMFISMFISPLVAVIVGIGSGLGFAVSGMPPYVVFRAFMHIGVGYLGAKILQKNKNFKKASIYTAPLHGILEGLIVIPFGFNFYEIIVVTAIGTIVHHFIDASIAGFICSRVSKATKKDMYVMFK